MMIIVFKKAPRLFKRPLNRRVNQTFPSFLVINRTLVLTRRNEK